MCFVQKNHDIEFLLQITKIVVQVLEEKKIHQRNEELRERNESSLKQRMPKRPRGYKKHWSLLNKWIITKTWKKMMI